MCMAIVSAIDSRSIKGLLFQRPNLPLPCAKVANKALQTRPSPPCRLSPHPTDTLRPFERLVDWRRLAIFLRNSEADGVGHGFWAVRNDPCSEAAADAGRDAGQDRVWRSWWDMHGYGGWKGAHLGVWMMPGEFGCGRVEMVGAAGSLQISPNTIKYPFSSFGRPSCAATWVFRLDIMDIPLTSCARWPRPLPF